MAALSARDDPYSSLSASILPSITTHAMIRTARSLHQYYRQSHRQRHTRDDPHCSLSASILPSITPSKTHANLSAHTHNQRIITDDIHKLVSAYSLWPWCELTFSLPPSLSEIHDRSDSKRHLKEQTCTHTFTLPLHDGARGCALHARRRSITVSDMKRTKTHGSRR